MNLYGFLTLIAVFLYLQAGGFSLISKQRTSLKFLFSVLCFAFAWYSFWVLMFQLQIDDARLHVMDAWASLGWVSFPLFLVSFFYHLAQASFPRIRKLIYFFLLPVALLIIIRYFWDPLSLKTFYQINGIWFFRVNLYSAWTYLYIVYLLLCGLISFFLLIHWHDTLKTNKEELQFRIIFGSLGVSFIISLITNVAFPLVGQQMLPGLAHLNFLPLIAGIFYANVSYAPRIFSPQLSDLLVSKYLDQFLFILDTRAQLISTNQYTVSRLRYYDKQALVNAFPSGLFPDVGPVEAFIGRSLRNQKEPERFETVLLARDGKKIPAELFPVIISDRFKRNRGLVIFGSECGRIKQLQKSLGNQESRKQSRLQEHEDLISLINRREAEWHDAREKLDLELLECDRAERQMRDNLLQQQGFVQEIYHRVKNSIQIAVALTNMLGSYEEANGQHKRVIGDIVAAMRHIADIHDVLYGKLHLSDSGLRKLIEQTAVNDIMGLPEDVRPQMKMNLSEEDIPIAQAIPLGLAFREMFSGFIIIFKQQMHVSQPGPSVHIALKKQQNSLILSVEDNLKIPIEERIKTDAYRIKIRFLKELAKEHLFGRLTILEQEGLMLSMRVPMQNS